MCEGIPLFADNEKALFGVGTNSHSTAAGMLKIDEDKFRKYEYHWWDKELVEDHYDMTAEEIVSFIDKTTAFKLVQKLVKTKLSQQSQIVAWLKKTPDEWSRLMEPKNRTLAKKVYPKLLFYEKKLSNFKISSKTNPYNATKLPLLKTIKKAIPAQVWSKIGSQIWAQVWSQIESQIGSQIESQVEAQIWAQVWSQILAKIRVQIWSQVEAQIWSQVEAQIWAQVWSQIESQVEAQIWSQVEAASYWTVKIALGLPIKHWFFDFLKLGIIIVFVKGKMKVFGKKGKYLGEYNKSDFKSY